MGQSSTLPSFVQSREAADETPLKKEYVLIDSRDRDLDLYHDPGEYIVQLPETLRQVASLTLIGAEIPSSFFVFTSARKNTSLIVTYQNKTREITIDDGNYGFSNMIATLKDKMNEAFEITSYEGFNVIINSLTLFLTIQGPKLTPESPRDDFSITIVTGDREWPLSYYLGFGRGNMTLESSQGILTGSNVCSLNPELYVCVEVSGANQILESSVLNEGGTMGQCAALIPLNVDSFQYMFFDKPIVPNVIQPPIAKMSSLHIKFRFHDGTPIDFNGVNHALTFEIQCSRTL
jgi:hypothetical protein